jgi:hypothetical protein
MQATLRLVLEGRHPHVVNPYILPLLIIPIIISSHPIPSPALLSEMLIILPVAGALLAHNALAMMISSRGRGRAPQVVLSNHDDLAAPSSILEDVDTSEGWADPRINGGRFLDVCLVIALFFFFPRNARDDSLGCSSPGPSSASLST